MNSAELRQLFEMMCWCFDAPEQPLHFRVGYEVESPEQVVMVFVFLEGVLVQRFARLESELSPLSMEEQRRMLAQLRSHTGGFAELFNR